MDLLRARSCPPCERAEHEKFSGSLGRGVVDAAFVRVDLTSAAVFGRGMGTRLHLNTMHHANSQFRHLDHISP